MNGEPASPVCAYCGLPVSPGLFRRAVGSERVESASVSPQQADDAYCCFGCRFAAAVSAENGEEGRNRWTLTRLGIAIFFSMNVMVFTMSLWSRDVYADHPSVQSTSAQAMYELLRYGCLLFTCPVLLLLGQPILEQCGQSLRRGQVTMDWLLLAGVVASFVYSILALLTGQAHVYFEVACMVLVAVTLGRWIEATGKLRTTQAVRSLQRLLPAFARVRVNGHTTQFVDRPLSDVMVGEVIRVLPGERIPLDGIVEQSRAHVDQQLITGESQPVVCETGDRVFAGSLNLDGDLTVRVETPASEGTLQRLVDLVTNALATKGQEQRLADRITAWFVPAVAAIAIGALLIHGMQFGWHEGLMTSLAVVLIACPCALGIATPMAFWAGLGTACRQQVLFRHGDALTTLARVKAVCFDKTGTITSGDVSVDSLLVDAGTSKADVLPIARALAETSTHPLSKAIVTYACSHADADQGAESLPRCDYVETIAGRGIRGQLNGVESDAVYLGNRAYMDQMGMAMSGEMRSAADSEIQSVAYLGWQGRVHGVFRFRETIRQESQQALARLREMGIHVAILTGDHASRGQYLSKQLGVDVLTDLLPQGKLNELTKLKGKFGLVAMVGDGVNDAPALAASDVGIAMGCGADVSRDAADVCLLGDDLTRIPWAIELARMTQRTIRQNLFWAFGYNGVGVTMAIFGWLNPIVAAIAMVGSSLFVISNSLALSATSVPDPFMPSRETDQKSHGTRPTVSRISGTLKPNMKEDLVKVPS